MDLHCVLTPHELTGPQLAQLFELQLLDRQVSVCDEVIFAFENPTAGVRIIPKQDYQKAIIDKEIAQRKLNEQMQLAPEVVQAAFHDARAYMKPVEVQ